MSRLSEAQESMDYAARELADYVSDFAGINSALDTNFHIFANYLRRYREAKAEFKAAMQEAVR